MLNVLVKSIFINSNPYLSLTNLASVASVLLEWHGRVIPTTFSLPSAFENIAATTPESFPPLIPNTTPFKLYFLYEEVND